MIITTLHPYSFFIHPFLDGVEIQSCIMIGTESGLVMFYDGIDTTKDRLKISMMHGKVSFKISRDANIPEPYFTTLTKDIGFAGFFD